MKQKCTNSTPFIWVVPLREPIERVTSHFYQDRPCPDGHGGSAVLKCRQQAKKGYLAWINTCIHGSNYQSNYFPKKETLHLVDQIVLNNRLEESLVLLHLQFPSALPLEKLAAGKYKSRVHALKLMHPNETRNADIQGEIPSCTDQWLSMEGVKRLDKFANCELACAGSFGFQLRSVDEKRATVALNQKDAELWRYANVVWEKQKAIVLKTNNVSWIEFTIMVKNLQLKNKTIFFW